MQWFLWILAWASNFSILTLFYTTYPVNQKWQAGPFWIKIIKINFLKRPLSNFAEFLTNWELEKYKNLPWQIIISIWKKRFWERKKKFFYLQNFADTHSYDVISYQLLTLLENLPWADLLNFFAHFHGPQIIPLHL